MIHRQPHSSQETLPPCDEHAMLQVMSLRALLYCERLFYLEQVEGIYVANDHVYAGRRIHEEALPLDDETPERRSVHVASQRWGLYGKVDAVRRRDGHWVVYEHKKGRCRRGENNRPEPWPGDKIQAIAYAVLLEEELGQPVPQARIRYHADNVTAFVTIDDAARQELRQAILRARQLQASCQRPPVTENERLCPGCSLNVVCLPEEERLQKQVPAHKPRLFPADRQRETLHVVSRQASIGRSGESLLIRTEEGKTRIPLQQIDSVLIHGYAQISTQALHLCAAHQIPAFWLSAGGRFVAGSTHSPGRVQQRIRQYQALLNPDMQLRLSRQLVRAKVESQLRYLLRATRGRENARQNILGHIERMRECLAKTSKVDSIDSLRGLEGMAAKAYFAALPCLINPRVPSALFPNGRNKRPPKDRFNCLLGFGYALLQSLVLRSILAVGLEPAFGFYHRPRSSAPPLVLDIMELFRTPIWDIALLGSINRGQWDPDSDFQIAASHVWLSESGRKKAIALFEQRLQESYRHPYTGRSLSYARIVEMEVRLLEKEWSGCPNTFAQMKIR